MRGKKKGTGQAVPETKMGLKHLFTNRVRLFLSAVKGDVCRSL